MKKLYLLLLFAFSFVTNAQIVNIPNAAFKAKLLSAAASNSVVASTQTPVSTNGYGFWSVSSYSAIDTNGDGEIQVSEAQAIKWLDVAGTSISGIYGLTGIEAFTNLEYLNCSRNYLNLASLDVSGLTNLQALICQDTQLQSLNVSGLTNLKYLNCNDNRLTSLDVSSLTNLTQLNCNLNRLPSLNVSSLTNLKSLSCGSNQLPSLNVSGLTNLESLGCYNNQLPSLNVLGLMNLRFLDCDNNQLQSLNVSGLTNLERLDCYNNQLQSLNVSQCLGLKHLSCVFNQLTSLNVSQNSALYDLYCGNNQITSLDFSLNPDLGLLESNNNSLVSLNIKNGNLNNWSYLNFSNNPNLTYVCADDENVNLVQQKINAYGYGAMCQVNSYCSFSPGGSYYAIQGNNKFDSNNNGCTISDPILPNLKYNITNGTNSGSIISNPTGNYYIRVSAGNHTVTPVIENPTYFNISPTTVNVTFPTQASPFTQNFCVTPNGVHPDLEVTLLPLEIAIPGFDATYKIIYKNKGNTIQSGNVNLVFNDAVLDLVSANSVATSQTLNNLSWAFTNLQPFETREINLTLNVNSPMETPAVNGGDILNYTATITSAAIDDLPNDNTFAYNQTVVNSYDPNDKTCLEGNIIPPTKVGDYVHYMIRFENNGTANAQNIVVKDIIDLTKFDINTIVPIKGSHSFVTNITAGNKVEFIFENINLPFANATNDGYVSFKIKTKPTLVLGNTFSNSASIYFDYNFPIVTNTATTTIAVLATQDFEFKNYFSLYPNPVSDILNITSTKNSKISSISIYNSVGQLVLVIPNAQETKAVDVSSLSSGNYFIKINSDKGTANTKFIKQ